MGFTQFNGEPIVISAQEEATYDKYWLQKLVVRAPEVGEDATLTADFIMCRDILDAEGNIIDKIAKPNAKAISIKYDKLFKNAFLDEELAQAMEGVFRILKKIGIEQGIFKSEEE